MLEQRLGLSAEPDGIDVVHDVRVEFDDLSHEARAEEVEVEPWVAEEGQSTGTNHLKRSRLSSEPS